MTKQVRLTESIVSAAPTTSGKRWRAKIIQGDMWGSSAYYPKEVLERDGARIFPSGLQMYLNHQSEQEGYEHPERKVQDMVGKLITDAEYDPIEGALFADVEFYDTFVASISEKAQDIGLSVHADGLTEYGDMDGRYGPVLVALLGAKSVDVVTKAGAGGKLTSILESDRELAGSPIEQTQEGTQSMTDVTKEDFEEFKTTLLEAITAIPVALTEALKAPATDEDAVDEGAAEVVTPAVVVESKVEDEVEIDHAAIVEALATNHLPASTVSKIITSLKEGKTIEAAVQEQIELREAFISAEQGAGQVVIQESGKASGLARSVKVLG